MSIKIEDKKLKTRLAQYGPSELFGPIDSRAGMTQEQLIELFDTIWNEKLRDAINQATACDVMQAYFLLTDAEKKFFDLEQEHRQFRIKDEGLEFIAQIETTLADGEGSLTQLWKVVSVDVQVYGMLLKKQREAQKWSEAYYELGANYKNKYILMGALAAIVTILTGSSVFAELLGSFGPLGPKIVGAFTLTAGALTAVHTFLDYGRESAKFEAAGKGWGKLARKIDQKILAISTSDKAQSRILKDVIEEMNELEDFSPTLTPSVYEKAKKELGIKNDNKLSMTNWPSIQIFE